MTSSPLVILARRAASGAGNALLAAVVAAVVAALQLVAFALVEWPAFNSSNVTRALTTVGQVGAAVLLVAAVVLLRRHRLPWLAKLLSWAGISTFVTVTLGMPLAATKLYLFGISVDQEFRTEYLTRLTDSAALRDMTYADLPPFYPAGWFWLGGRVANLLGMDGWEVFKPYAIVALAVASVLALVLWSELIRADLAVAVTAATVALTLAYAAPEAYSAVLVVLIAPALVLAWGALHRPGPRGSSAGGWGAVLGTGLFLGLCATFYTLYAALAAFAVGLMGLLAAWSAVRARRAEGKGLRGRRSVRSAAAAPLPTSARADGASAAGAARADGDSRAAGHGVGPHPLPAGGAWRAAVPPLGRLAVIAGISALVALLVWTPYLLEAVTGEVALGGGAFHYLPEAGAELPLPMAEFSLRGALCLLGLIWLVVRSGSSRRAQALGIGVAAVYLWTLLSMLATVAGTTLLSFRLEPILLVLLAAAGTFGFFEGARAVYRALNEPERFRAVAVAVGLAGALAFAQQIPHVLAAEITTAYTDTDGDGNRADKRDPSAVTHYRQIDEELRAQTGRAPADTVLLTADTSFLAYYPYFGFQGLTSHYANPLADFAGRAAAIERWSELETPAELLAALDAAPWRAPDAFLFRRGGDGYTLRLAADVYPNDPNVRRYTVSFPAELFADPAFTVTDIGPFTLVTVAR
ncbi:galactan 5-O-arabinofuranosyltransferase [Nocardia jiangsuensis]|uniref:Galactan 5-O-arabinofuranosyltransferase n=1 Tax=Nocardia jiangsuensis TaxID=1691563 RepID=A0ABV8DV58_9NOCA